MTSRRALDGILLLDKPKGITSNGALQMAKRLYRAKKAGHSGSLDPVASGLLPICFGEATKFSRFLLEADKHYQVVAKLGVRTESGDSEGNTVAEKPVPLYSLEQIEAVLVKFRGDISQVPSMFSAIKYQGQPLYKYARQGIVIERAARDLSVYQLTLLEWQPEIASLTLEIKASKGTYVRTLVDDIGEALGCGAHVLELRRLGAGPYTASQMVTFETLQAVLDAAENLDQYLLPLNSSVEGMPDLVLSDAAAYYIRKGQAVTVPYAPTEGWVRLSLKDNQFLGVGEILDDGRVAPRRLTQEILSI